VLDAFLLATETDYSAMASLPTESMDWASLERIWKDLQKSTEEDPKWIDFWKSLDNWARNNINHERDCHINHERDCLNQGAPPKTEWNRMQVAAWARKVLDFSEESAKILISKAIDGAVLPLVESSEKLESFGIPYGFARKLWAEIEKLKKSLAEPGKLT
jgi:hypothetical protein